MAETLTAPTPTTPGHATTTAPVASQRFMSVDALRGFDMFWITGAASLFLALEKMFPNDFMHAVVNQLRHAPWEGFHFEDFIFPLFVFVMGASAVFSLTKLIREEGRAAALKRVFRRFVVMFILALIYSGGFSTKWPDIRLMGVLNRIALCYFFGSLVFIYHKPRMIAAITVALLLGYWALLAWVPFPDVRVPPGTTQVINKDTYPTKDKLNMASTTMIHGSYIQGVNLANYIDQKYLPGKGYDGTYDPEGILSTMGAVCTCLLGIFAGLLLKNGEIRPNRKVIYLLSLGVAGVLVGFLWGTQFPVIKKIWTSSYVLVAGGYSAIALGIFYWVVDILQFRKWCQPFVWMGMNSITIYFLVGFVVSFKAIAARLVGGDIQNFLNNKWDGLGDFGIASVAIVLTFWLLHFLYRRKIFLRL